MNYVEEGYKKTSGEPWPEQTVTHRLCYADRNQRGLCLAGEFLLEGSEGLDVTKGCFLNRGGEHGSLFASGTAGGTLSLAGLGALCLAGILEDAAVREDDCLLYTSPSPRD